MGDVTDGTPEEPEPADRGRCWFGSVDDLRSGAEVGFGRTADETGGRALISLRSHGGMMSSWFNKK